MTYIYSCPNCGHRQESAVHGIELKHCGEYMRRDYRAESANVDLRGLRGARGSRASGRSGREGA